MTSGVGLMSRSDEVPPRGVEAKRGATGTSEGPRGRPRPSTHLEVLGQVGSEPALCILVLEMGRVPLESSDDVFLVGVFFAVCRAAEFVAEVLAENSFASARVAVDLGSRAGDVVWVAVDADAGQVRRPETPGAGRVLELADVEEDARVRRRRRAQQADRAA